MGGDGRRADGLPVSLKVKNTFIDVNHSFVEDDPDDVAFLHTSMMRKRQVSEPVPSIQRQLSDAPLYRTPGDPRVGGGLLADGLLEEEELECSELDEVEEREEPETEKDPCWVLGRQETEQAWPTMLPARQETEQCWPSWGPAAASTAGAALGQADPMLLHAKEDSSAVGMWMYQMPGVDGSQPASLADLALGGAPWPGLASPFLHGEEAGAAGASGPAAEHAGGLGQVEANPAEFAGAAMGGFGAPPPEWVNTSTVMMRNLPNKYTQQMLLEELNQSGYQGSFDFMYLPIDPETHANRGYAFINFIDPSFAWMLKMSYEGRKMSRFNSEKVVSVAPAALQGFEANYAHYSTARVNRGDPAARPLFLGESRMRQAAPRHDGGRRRGGRRSSGSLIDMAAKQKQHQQAAMSWSVGGLSGQLPAAAGLDGGGSIFSDGAVAKGAGGRADTAEQPTPKFCPYCGGKCQPQFRFCQFCGASLSLKS